MATDCFLENGESIVFDKYGILKDGQHRLNGIVATGKSYHICVVRGVEPDVMSTIDTGKSRTPGDVLYLNGFQNANKVAALIVVIKKWGGDKSRSVEMKNSSSLSLTNNNITMAMDAASTPTKASKPIVNNTVNNTSSKNKERPGLRPSQISVRNDEPTFMGLIINSTRVV